MDNKKELVCPICGETLTIIGQEGEQKLYRCFKCGKPIPTRNVPKN